MLRHSNVVVVAVASIFAVLLYAFFYNACILLLFSNCNLRWYIISTKTSKMTSFTHHHQTSPDPHFFWMNSTPRGAIFLKKSSCADVCNQSQLPTHLWCRQQRQFLIEKKEPSQWGPSSPIFSGCLIILFLLVVFRMRNHQQWQYFKVAYYRP